MKVLFVTNFCTHFLVRTFEAIAKLGDVRFIFYSDGGEKYWEKNNKLHSGNFEHRYLPGVYVFRRIRLTPSLPIELLRSRAEVVVMGLAGRFALPVTYLLTRLRRKPFILWTGIWYHPQTFFHKISKPLTFWIYRHSDAILVYGEHIKSYLIQLGVDPKRIFLFWQSVNVEEMGRAVSSEKVQAIRQSWSKDGSPVILYVGRLDPVKSLDTLVEAYGLLRKDRPCHLVIVGQGSEEKSLKALAQRLGLSPVFQGYVPNPELPEIYASAEVFCLPSRSLPAVKEAWGLVLNEAMLQRCIPVASDAVGAAVGGLFPEGLAELVFPERDVLALKNSLSKALDQAKDPQMREKIREKARYFTNEKQAQGLLEAYQYVMAERRP